MTSAKSGIRSQSGSANSDDDPPARGSASPRSAATASGSDPTAKTRTESAATAPSDEFPAGTINVRMRGASLRTSSATGRHPFTARTVPSSESSPTIIADSRASRAIPPVAAIRESAMGRSNAAPSFFISAGARFTSVWPCGCPNPQAFSADLIRSRLSRIAGSGSPTIATNDSSPRPLALTSTSTATASIPAIAPENVLVSILPVLFFLG